MSYRSKQKTFSGKKTEQIARVNMQARMKKREPSLEGAAILENRVLLAGLAQHLFSNTDNPAPGTWSTYAGTSGPLTVQAGQTILGNNHATKIPANYGQITNPSSGNKRGFWDYTFTTPQDLSQENSFSFDLYTPNITPIGSMTIYFKTGADDWYYFSVNKADMITTGWKTFTFNLKDALVEDSGTAGVAHGWRNITAIRISPWAVSQTETGDGTLYISNFKAGDSLVIDSFDYSANPSQAAVEWVPSSSFAPASGTPTAVNFTGKNVTQFGVNFASQTTGSRANWDNAVDLDLTFSRGIEFDIYSANTTPISNFTLYLASGSAWYSISFSIENPNQWNHVKLDLMNAVIQKGPGGEAPLGWANISTIRLSAWRSTNVNTSFYMSNMKVLGGRQDIDLLEYANNAAAQAVWTELTYTSQGAVNIDHAQTGGRTLALPVEFAGAASDPTNTIYARSSWDALINFSLEGQLGSQFDFKVTDKSAINFITVYFGYNSSWTDYVSINLPMTDVVNGQWKTFTLKKEDMSITGSPASWNFNRLRFSIWRNTSATPINTNAYIRNFTTITPEVVVVRHEPVDSVWASAIANMYNSVGVSYVGISDKDITLDRLKKAKLIVLPYVETGGTYAFSSTAASNLVDAITNYGVKYLGFYGNQPAGIYTALGMGNGVYINGATNNLDFDRISVTTSLLPGSPSLLLQNSSNVYNVQAISGQSTVYATWQDPSGNNLVYGGNPVNAIVGNNSGKGILMTHVLISDDLANKQKLLVAMTDKLVPGAWANAASQALFNIGYVGSYTKFSEAKTDITNLASTNGTTYQTSMFLDSSASSAETLRNTAITNYNADSFISAYTNAINAKDAVIKAYSAAQLPLAGEARMFFAHDAYPPAGETWDSTIKKLADNGFNGIAVNLLTGTTTFYATSVAGMTNVSTQGDQLSLLSAASTKYGVDLYVWKTDWRVTAETPAATVVNLFNAGKLQQPYVNTDSDPNNNSYKIYNGVSVPVIPGSGIPYLDPAVQANRDMEVASMVELATKPGVKGILFDYIRYPDSKTSFSDASKNAFAASIGQTVGSIDWAKLSNMDSTYTYTNDWITWRQSLITDVVNRGSTQAKLANSNLKVTAAVFSNWIVDKNTIGQDWILWLQNKYLDFAVPMDYADNIATFNSMISNQKTWITDNVPTGNKTIYPAIGLTSTGNNLSPDEVVDQINTTRTLNTGGFYVFNLAASELNTTTPVLGRGITNNNPFQVTSGFSYVEAENYQARSSGQADTWTVLADSLASGTKAVKLGTVDGSAAYSGTTAPYMDYKFNVATTGNHYLWLRGKYPNTSGDSVKIELYNPSGTLVTINTAYNNVVFTGGTNSWKWKKASTTAMSLSTTGVWTIRVRGLEDGLLLDKLILTTSSTYSPPSTGTGPAQSNRVVPAPLTTGFIGPAGDASSASFNLSLSQLSPIVDAAKARWVSTGVSASAFDNLQFQIADLGGAALAVQNGDTIIVDDDAAGAGWFIDMTPDDDSEFTTAGDQGEQGHFDLLSTLAHEMGHKLGLDHSGNPNSVMFETLDTGDRHAPASTDLLPTSNRKGLWKQFLTQVPISVNWENLVPARFRRMFHRLRK